MGTIHHIMRRHPREALYVQPLEWTSRHLELLECSFVSVDFDSLHEHMSAQLSLKTEQKLSSDYYARIAEGLPTSDTKNGDIGNLLSGPDGPLQRQDFFGFLHYGPGKDQKARLHGGTFAPTNFKSTGENKPATFAFLQREMIEFQRSRLYPMPRSNRPGHQPWTRVREIRMKRITPPDPYRDPLIAAVLIGLAQSQAAADVSKLEKSKRCAKDLESIVYPVSALLIDDDESGMTLYTSEVTAAFLTKFIFPEALRKAAKVAPSCSLSIRYGKVSYQPYLTLRQRLCQEIASSSTEGS